jgi:hypothetical protein
MGRRRQLIEKVGVFTISAAHGSLAMREVGLALEQTPLNTVDTAQFLLGLLL